MLLYWADVETQGYTFVKHQASCFPFASSQCVKLSSYMCVNLLSSWPNTGWPTEPQDIIIWQKSLTEWRTCCWLLIPIVQPHSSLLKNALNYSKTLLSQVSWVSSFLVFTVWKVCCKYSGRKKRKTAWNTGCNLKTSTAPACLLLCARV